MASRDYILPTDSLSLSQQQDYRFSAIAAALERATVKGIGSIGDDEIAGYNAAGTTRQRISLIKPFLAAGNMPRSLDVREAQNILDFGAALDQWNTAALAVVGTNYSVFQAVAAPTLANNKLAVFYKIGCETLPPPVSRVTFRSGGATGNIIAVYDLEMLFEQERLEGYFSEPVVIDPTIIFSVQVMARTATGVLARIPLGCFIVEPAGQTIA